MKAITVVTVVRNAGSLLERTVRSVNDQTVRPLIDYLVIDGASTDGTAQVVRTSAESCRIDRWLSEPDRGIYDAMSKGLSMAEGEWILFMNAGDGFHTEDTLEKLWHQAEARSGCSGVYGGCIVIHPDGRRQEDRALEPRRVYTRMVCSHQSLLLRTEKAREYPFDLAYKIAADHHQLMRMVRSFEPLWPLPMTVAEVGLETYSWTQIKAGLGEKRRALWRETGNIFFYLYHWLRYVLVGLKHIVKKGGKRVIM